MKMEESFGNIRYKSTKLRPMFHTLTSLWFQAAALDLWLHGGGDDSRAIQEPGGAVQQKMTRWREIYLRVRLMKSSASAANWQHNLCHILTAPRGEWPKMTCTVSAAALKCYSSKLKNVENNKTQSQREAAKLRNVFNIELETKQQINIIFNMNFLQQLKCSFF